MIVRNVLGFLVLTVVFYSCFQKRPYGNPVQAPATILKDMESFWNYKARNVRLYEDYQALDPESNVIPKKDFLKKIATGEYFPLRLSSIDSMAYYRLQPIKKTTNQDIRTTVKYWGLEELEHFQKEGTAMPDYQWVDMEGKRYTKETTKGKILVVKCWFLACLPCIQEMPALNELKRQYESRDDLLFVSLCMDPSDKVAAFLMKKQFDYATVPDQESFLTDQLQLNAYPTHFVINKKGLITKKVNDYHALAYALKKETSR
ncbi:TlpA family protein disulfide reductase [Larkinella rosea]|uniref:TlpA family protein disulfide reductase n=1 Tax=Larkinella rosea TaxID=2025312 RepID=A0A3P1BNA6_9BACT|nr:TlpA disulfide reductase family protein [Larkinella rosea]RRB02561.1 TlpA family protein disulfide reductase [Larkinella rosea]